MNKIESIIEEAIKEFNEVCLKQVRRPSGWIFSEVENAMDSLLKKHLQEMYEEGVRDNKKIRCNDCKDFLEYLKISGKNWEIIEEHVVKAEVAWHELLEKEIKQTKQQLIKEIWDLLFECYPDDMENFSTMTEDQAYRLLKKFWEKLSEKEDSIK